jgi:hypothetical protein
VVRAAPPPILRLSLLLPAHATAPQRYSIIPASLLNQNFSVSKALLTDYVEQAGGSKADVAGAVGKLGMAIGLSFMAGPLASQLVSGYQGALRLSAGLLGLSSLLILILPTPAPPGTTHTTPTKAPPQPQGGSVTSKLTAFFDMPVLKTRGAQLLMAMRLLMAFAFHIWAPVWNVSIRRRFNFGPADHGKFMGIVGLTYAISQGAIAKPLIRRAGNDTSRLLLLCIALLGASRPFALWAQSVGVIYALYVPMVIGLGVMNTAISTACTSLAEGEQLGGLFGVLESVESVAGMVGPTLGGLAAAAHDDLPLASVCTCYMLCFVLVALFYRRHIVEPSLVANGARKAQ